jgi:uncharacterized protein (TIGR03086 family)
MAAMTNLIALHRGVLESTVALANQVKASDLDLATPCTGWDLRDLLAHMIGENYGFADAAEGGGREVADFAPRPIGDDPGAEYAVSADRVIQAFATPGLLDRTIYLAEVRAGATFPGKVAVGFHLIGNVAHGWDIAKTLAVTPEFDDEALRAALAIAAKIPTEAKTDDEGTPFRPDITTTSTAPLDQIVAALGRAPDWTPTR